MNVETISTFTIFILWKMQPCMFVLAWRKLLKRCASFSGILIGFVVINGVFWLRSQLNVKLHEIDVWP